MIEGKIKKRQHFISQSYLKNWGRKVDKNCKIYTFIDGKIHQKLTEDIGHERYFYEIHGINEAERAILLNEVARVQTPHVGELIRSIIEGCFLIGTVEDRESLQDNHIVNLYKKNTIEDYYGITEDVVSAAYKKVLSGRLDDVDINDYQNILRFSVYQLGKTPKVREKIRIDTHAKLAESGIRFDRWYTMSMLMTCENIFLSFIEKLYKITVINNCTTINYITNDNPVFNMRGIEDENIELFWPISPKKAIAISPSTISEAEARAIKDRWIKNKIITRYFIESSEENDSGRVSDMNKLAWDNKHRFAFASEESEFQKFISST